MFAVVSTFAFAKSDTPKNELTELLKTKHFDIRYKNGQTTPKEAQAIGEKAEVFYKRLHNYLGRKPKNKITICLEGNRGDDPKHKWAYVDETVGWMHLFRFPEDTFSYQTGLSHELVHAYRFEHLSNIEMPPSPTFIFLEEGLAEYLSNVIEPKKETFANYGYDLGVIAGQWITSDEDIPLETLLKEQYRLRPRCIPQAYTQQASFMQFIELELGVKTVKRLAYAKDILDKRSLTPYLKEPFPSFAGKWKASTLERFNKIPNSIEQASKWRNSDSVTGMHICKKGTDF